MRATTSGATCSIVWGARQRDGTIFNSYWYAALRIVVEGWRERSLAEIDALIPSDHAAGESANAMRLAIARITSFVEKSMNSSENNA